MGSNSTNAESQVIVIEDDIIDLDEADKTPEEVIYEWDAKIRKKLSSTVVDNEYVLGDLMKEYLESLQEMTRSFEDNATLKNKVQSHITFLYLYYGELQCCGPDNYLNHMEDILTIYCNLVLEIVCPLKKKDLSKQRCRKRIVLVAGQMIHILTVYLLEHHDHILHVLIKMNTKKVSDGCTEVLNILYKHFLTKVPAFSLSDESFCRTYIVFQKWKEIRKREEWKKMDEIMYIMFKRTPESIKSSETLRQILMPSCSSTVDTVLNLFCSYRAISGAYFKHIVSKKNVELEDLVLNIDLGEEEPVIPANDEEDEEVQFLKAYYEMERNMSNLSHMPSTDTTEIDIFRKCKEECDDDDDVQFVGITQLPKPSLLSFEINKENDYAVSNIISQPPKEKDPPPIPLIEKTSSLENLNGVTALRSQMLVPEMSDSCQTPEQPPPTSDTDVHLPNQTDLENITTETTPKVPFVPNISQEPDRPSVEKSVPSSPEKSVASVCNDPVTKPIEMKSVEVQADNYLYTKLGGLNTPPFHTDEQMSAPIEPCVYTNIGASAKKDPDCEKRVVSTRTVEVQVEPPDKNCPYDPYGLTPPNETHLEDHNARLQEPLYTSIGHKSLGTKKVVNFSDHCEVFTYTIPDVAQEHTEIETDKEADDRRVSDQPVESDEYEGEIDTPEVSNTEAESDLEIDVDTCSEPDPASLINSEIDRPDMKATLSSEKPEAQNFKTNDQIDTGQKSGLICAPNIRPPVTAESEMKGPPTELYNGNTVLKPLVSSNRTNGQAVSTSTNIMYSHKIRPSPLDDFSRFENALHNDWNKAKENKMKDFDDIWSGPVTKVAPAKQNNLLSSQDKLDLFSAESQKPVVSAHSRSNSPTDMTSPDYEAIDDFRNYFSDSVNGRVPPPHDTKVPPGILKKTRNQNCNVYSRDRKPHSDGILVPKRILEDPKLNMYPSIVLERLSFIENKMKKVLNNSGTIRVDYDKTTRHINEKDVVRCISPPRMSWVVTHVPSRHNPGSLSVKTSELVGKKPKKRKYEMQSNTLGSEPGVRKRGRPRKQL